MPDVRQKRVKWNEVAARFTHIDATFVEADCRIHPGDASARYVVRFYPWWEHPEYVAAVERGQPWGFGDIDDAARDVAVYPINLVACRLSRRREVINWAFSDDHPLLWEYEESGQIFCNNGFDADALVAQLMAMQPPWVTPRDLHRYVGHGWRSGAPFALPAIPRTPYRWIRHALEEAGVRTFAPREPVARKKLVAMVIDGEDYFIAEDFELDVPDFVHAPEWFQPVAG